MQVAKLNCLYQIFIGLYELVEQTNNTHNNKN
jgi:hypothetical protein